MCRLMAEQWRLTDQVLVSRFRQEQTDATTGHILILPCHDTYTKTEAIAAGTWASPAANGAADEPCFTGERTSTQHTRALGL